MINIFIFVLAYLLGSIPSGLIIGKAFYKIDIREHGSGNLGGTNTFRTLGKKAGLIVTFADILKGTLAAALPLILSADLHVMFAGLFAIIGHMYPLFANFRGGKAVATSAGVLLFATPLLFVILFFCFFISLYLSKYVSLSSMICSVIAVIYALFTKDIVLIGFLLVFAIFIIYRHRSNIRRIIDKTEPKVSWL